MNGKLDDSDFATLKVTTTVTFKEGNLVYRWNSCQVYLWYKILIFVQLSAASMWGMQN
jgi:hypothetical protein